MNKIAQLQTECAELKKQIELQQKDFTRLKEIEYRRAAQDARRNALECTEMQKLKETLSFIYRSSFKEIYLSLIGWLKLPKSFNHMLTSKRIEQMILKYKKVCLFRNENSYQSDLGKKIPINEFCVLPFTGEDTLDIYGEFIAVRPYVASGSNQIFVSKPLIVNKDCVIITDYFDWNTTVANDSGSVELMIDTLSDFMADCEVAKMVNRNWTKIPILFENNPDITGKVPQSMGMELAQLINSIMNNDAAALSPYIKNIKTIDVKSQFLGDQIEAQRRQYENEILNFIGCPNLRDEKKDRLINKEMESNESQYSINLMKRMQNRERPLKIAGDIWNEWKDVKLVNNVEKIKKELEQNGVSDNDIERDRRANGGKETRS